MTTKSALRERLEATVLERHCANHPLTEKWAAGKAQPQRHDGLGHRAVSLDQQHLPRRIIQSGQHAARIAKTIARKLPGGSRSRAAPSGYHPPICRRQRRQCRRGQARPRSTDNRGLGRPFSTGRARKNRSSRVSRPPISAPNPSHRCFIARCCRRLREIYRIEGEGHRTLLAPRRGGCRTWRKRFRYPRPIRHHAGAADSWPSIMPARARACAGSSSTASTSITRWVTNSKDNL